MSAAGHTAGPWHVGMKPGPMIYGELGEQIADCRGLDEAGRNALRIVAAVNACEGIPTAALPSIARDVDSLIAERDSLRVALESLLDAHAQHSIKTAIQHYGSAHEKQVHAAAREQARAALGPK